MLPEPARIEEAVALLCAGELVAFPTETVYGLGADAENAAAVARIFTAKGRPASHPLIVHFSNFSAARAWASEIPPSAARLADAFWPGPLTLVLPKSSRVPAAVTGGQDTVALRAPAHPVARALLAAFGRGIAAPSANRYGRISPTRAADVREELGDRVSLILEGGDCEVGLESTIVACLGGRVTLLRPGSVSRSQVVDVVGAVDDAGADAPRAPGRERSHYAPGTPLSIAGAAELQREIDAALARGERVAVLARSAAPAPAPDGVAWKRMPESAAAYGRVLYSALRALDAAGADRILVEAVPPGEPWAAVADRLARAAARGAAAGDIADEAT
jgi:L-threonylcarbamoyladenylate synthase